MIVWPQGQGKPVQMATTPGLPIGEDSAKIWFIKPIVFVGGQPPPYKHIVQYDNLLGLVISGPSTDGESSILVEETYREDNPEWFLETHPVWYLD